MATEKAAMPEQTIREKAYHLWEQHGRPSGRDVEFWSRAAAMLATVKPSKAKRTKPAADQPAPTVTDKPVADKPAARRRTKSAA